MATTTTAATRSNFFKRRECLKRRIHSCATIGWRRLQGRHAEEAEEESHQRRYYYSSHQVCLPFLLSSN